MTWQGWGHTDVGRVRKVNQDAYQAYPTLRMWVVADGMGGHAGGEIASQVTIETVGKYIEQHTQQAKGMPLRVEEREALLQDALKVANGAIRARARENPEYAGMGTTAVLLYVSDSPSSQATIAHVGDSRAYLVHDDTLTLLTRDDSLVEDRIDLGIITREQALTHPLRHVLTRGLGIESEMEVSVRTIDLHPMDRILMCTDGLTKMMSDDQIFETFKQRQGSLQEACHGLVDQANRLGGEDNVTVVLVGAET